jgi:hypothetical protein
MSRDVLLACLTLALLLNLALLGQAANLYLRRSRSASRVNRERVVGPVREQAVMTLPHARPPAADAGSMTTNGSDHLEVIVATVEPAEAAKPEPAAPEPLATAGRTAEPKTEPPETRAHADATTPDAATNGTLPEPVPVTARPGTKRATRGRRFVLPPLDEDQARSVRAIEAFLDGPPPPPSGIAPERPQRRRHRVRRPAGSPVPRTTMVVWLHGFADLDRLVGTTRASSVSAAFVDALRRAARVTDEVREVGSGRVRVVVDTDDAGATAFVERARRGVQPWLELLAVPLKVESGARESSEVVPFTASRRVASDH